MILSSWWALKTKIKTKRAPLLLLIVLLQGIAWAKAFYAYDVLYIDQTFWPLAALVLCLSVRQINTSSLDAFLKFLFVFAVASDLIEVVLFLTIGRLPAQGYADSIAIRFGGWLDSPNDFACILFLLMGWALCRYRGFKRWAMEGALLLCLILTQSVTAYAFFVVAVAFLLAVNVVRRPRSLLWIAPLLAIVTAAAWAWLPDLFSALVENKMSSSISGHLRMPPDLLATWQSWALLGAPSFDFYENWWVSSLYNLGLPWLLVCLITILWLFSLVILAFINAKQKLEKAVLGGILAIASYCVLASWSFPILIFFPANFLFYLFCFLVAFGKLQHEAPSPAAAAPPSIQSLPWLQPPAALQLS
jgi:hypothetical protein